jgi:hypothetical protein
MLVSVRLKTSVTTRSPLPSYLSPTATQTLQALSGPITIAKATPTFQRWSGPLISDTYNGKQILDYNGRPAFAELAILWAMQGVGWNGVWNDTYSRAYRQGYWREPPVAALPANVATTLDKVSCRAGSRFGSWDVCCWRGNDLFFAESKCAGKDSIRETQIKWLEAALAVELRTDQFLIVEWTCT